MLAHDDRVPRITIREARLDDLAAIRDVTEAAFAASEFGHQGEAALIEQLDAAQPQLALVACAGTDVVGHILFTPVTLRSDRGELHGMGLAPMSVAPELQRKGIGSLLVTTGLSRLFDDGCRFVVVLGHPSYYPRFGFVPAAKFEVTHGFMGLPQDLFFIKFESSTAANAARSGKAFYHSAFGVQHT